GRPRGHLAGAELLPDGVPVVAVPPADLSAQPGVLVAGFHRALEVPAVDFHPALGAVDDRAAGRLQRAEARVLHLGGQLLQAAPQLGQALDGDRAAAGAPARVPAPAPASSSCHRPSPRVSGAWPAACGWRPVRRPPRAAPTPAARLPAAPDPRRPACTRAPQRRYAASPRSALRLRL